MLDPGSASLPRTPLQTSIKPQDSPPFTATAAPPGGTPESTSVLSDAPASADTSDAPPSEPAHQWLHVEKRLLNTRHVADCIAEQMGLPTAEIGYAGLKDRRAVTRQWFSAPRVVDASRSLSVGYERSLNDWGGTFRVLETLDANHKLRPGDHQGNRFSIRIRNVRGSTAGFEERIAVLAVSGAPNYFGPQRFGPGDENLRRAERWLRKRRLPRGRARGFIVSAARAWLFNHVLAARVLDGSWEQALAGDPRAAVDDGGAEGKDFEPVPTGPLWGRGRNPATATTADIEGAALAGMELWQERLEHSGSQMARRPLVCRPTELQAERDGSSCHLSFTLEAGEYATNVLHQCFDDLIAVRG